MINLDLSNRQKSVKSVQSVVPLPLFVLIGVLTAAVGELQFSVFIRGDWANLFGSMVFNAVYLAGAFVVTRLLFRLLPRRAAFLFTVVLAAVAGLMVEWFLIGTPPGATPTPARSAWPPTGPVWSSCR